MRVKVFVAGGDDPIGAGTFFHASWMGQTCVLVMDVAPDEDLLRRVNRLVCSGFECLVRFAHMVPRGAGVFKIVLPGGDLGKKPMTLSNGLG